MSSTLREARVDSSLSSIFRLQLSPAAARFDLVVAIAAVDCSALSRFERHFGIFATLSTHCGIHLSPRPVATGAEPVRSPCFATGWTALRLIGIALAREEFLLLNSKGEVNTTLEAL